MKKKTLKIKNKLFFIVYYIFALIIYIISLPFLFFLLFESKYKKSIPARFFLYKNPPFTKKRYWFHACSLGETKALKPIIDKFKEVNLSVITNTGFEEAKKYKNAKVRFLPYEIFLPFWIRECEKLIVLEAELWYMLFLYAKKRCKKTVLLNARISQKSYPKYLKFKWFYKRIFENIDLVLAQSEEDKEKLISLGAKNIEIIGNIKTIFSPKITTKYIKKKPILVIASTHENEEELILNNIPLNDYQVVVVPRHPERFDGVYKIMQKYGNVKRATELKMENGECELKDKLILMDKMGELVNLYAIADIVILGGSFVDNVGGHNPIEAAYFNTPIISGEFIFNQKALYSEVENIEICKPEEIKVKLKNLKPTFIKRKCNLEKIINRIENV